MCGGFIFKPETHFKPSNHYTMKKVLLISLCGMWLLSSCNKSADSVTPSSSTISSSAVPATVVASLQTTYPAATSITWSQLSPSTYQAAFTVHDTLKMAEFTTQGKCTGTHNEIATTSLPTSITDYLTANYAGYTVVKAGVSKDSSGTINNYKVLISVNGKPYSLEFDASGNFLKVETPDGHRAGNGITQANLPAAITDYLTTNYAGYAFNNAEVRIENGTTSGYEVVITQNNKLYFLLFDASGKFLSAKDAPARPDGHGGPGQPGGGHGQEKSIAQANLPAAVTTYLTTNYSGYAFVAGEVAADPAGNIVRYEVKFTLSGKSYEADFDGSGNFLSIH